MPQACSRELGTQLSTRQRLVLLARTALPLGALGLAGWFGELPAIALLLLAVLLLLRLITLFEDPMFAPSIVVTERDADRLNALIEALPKERREAVRALEVELERAQIVSSAEVPADVVTMNSRVRYEEVHSGERMEAQLVYPREINDPTRAVSVLAPVGSALLGLSVGHAIDWRMPNGRLRRYRVLDVLYQPEAAGDLHL